jgi:ParB-like chromosome segregation protein Spo0J
MKAKSKPVLPSYTIARMKLAALNPAPYNPRTISEAAKQGLKASITRYGCVEPIIANKRTHFTIVGGHRRYEVLLELGETETDVVVVDLPASEEKALNLALNNPAIAGEFTADVAEGYLAVS